MQPTYEIVATGEFQQHQIYRNDIFFASCANSKDAERIVKGQRLLDVVFDNQSPLAKRLAVNTVAVKSDWIESVGYDGQEKLLVLYKKDGKTIVHKNVDQRTQMQVLGAVSVGQAWNKYVKGNPAFTLVDQDELSDLLYVF
jgi:hypothetical protein